MDTVGDKYGDATYVQAKGSWVCMDATEGDVGHRHLTPAQARLLAASLVYQADVAEGACRG